MQSLGLSHADLIRYVAALRAPGKRRVRVFVTDLAGSVLARLVSNQVAMTSGSVTCDMYADVTRALQMGLLDRKHLLAFDTNSPNDAALFLDRMIRVDYGCWVPAPVSRWVDATVFNGPVNGLTRSEATIDVAAQGKEAFSRGEVYRQWMVWPGTLKTTAITRFLAERAGETQFNFTPSTARLGASVAIPTDAEGWPVLQTIARGMSRQLFYDGPGVATLRDWPSPVVHTFHDGDGGDITGPVTVAYGDNIKNVIVVTGGGDRPPVAAAVAPDSSLLSPKRLGRNGVPRYFVERVTDEALTTAARCQTAANTILADRLLTTVDVAFDSLVIPHLDLGDMVACDTGGDRFTFRLTKMTVPLSGGTMSVGYTARKPTPRGVLRR